MIIVRANARNATYISDDLITSGSVGIPVTFNLSEDFDGLSCIAVFEGSGVSIDVALMGNTCVVPHEVLATAGGYLRIGIYAANSEGTIVIPTVWAGSKMILQGTEPSEVDPSEPTPSWVAQVQEAAAEALANSEEAIEIAGGADAAAEEARQSASAAAASATAAGQSASVAGTAQAAAEAASGAAVSARDAAVAAQSGAESSASAAAGSATAAAGSAAAASASEAAARAVQESIPEDYADLSADVVELKSQIDIENLTDAHLKKAWRSDKNYFGLLKVYPFPDSSFDEIGVKVFSDGKNFLSDYSPKDHMVSGGPTYYYSPSGNNNNPGTRENPKLYPLRPYTDGATHIFMDGVYTRGQIPSVNKSANFVAEHPGKAILVNSDHYNYTYDSGIYYTARTSVLSVLIKVGEVYRPLDAIPSLEACKATPFSFYSGNPNVYINVAGAIVPTDDNTFLNIGTGLPLLSVKPDTGDINVYFDGFVFAGGHVGGVTVENTTDYTPTVYFNNCKFLGAYTTQSAAKDALSVLGGIAFLNNCEAAFARKDGFNYHAYNSKVPRAFEINCISHNNGFNGWDNTDNGSTIHDGGIVIRINGVYYGNKGANVADVHEGTKSLNLGCLAFNSLSTETGADSDFSAQQAGTTMWLDECKGYGSDWTIYAYTGTTMHLHNVEKETTNGGGTIDQEWNPWQS